MAFKSSASPLSNSINSASTKLRFSNIFDGIFWMLAILNSLKIKAKILAAVPLDDYLVAKFCTKIWP